MMNSNKSKSIQNHVCILEKCSRRIEAYKENILLCCFCCKQQFYARCFDIEFNRKESKLFFKDSHVQFICFGCFHKSKGVNRTKEQISAPNQQKKRKKDSEENIGTNTDQKLTTESIIAPNISIAYSPVTSPAPSVDLNTFSSEVRKNFTNFESKFERVFDHIERKY